MSELLDHPLTMDLNVRWGDMDAMGHTNNTIYFRYFESARIEFFRATDPEARLSGNENASRGYILASVSMDFMKPLSYPDELVVGVKPHDLKTNQYKLTGEIYSRDWEQIVAQGDSLLLCYNYEDSEVIPIPQGPYETIREMTD